MKGSSMKAEPLPTTEDALSTETTMAAVMTALPRTIAIDATFAEAHALMRDHHCRHLPVVNGGVLVGVVSQRDLYFFEMLNDLDPTRDHAADAMSTHVLTTTADAKVREVARAMAHEKYECAVIIDDQRVAGIFTATDAFRYLAGEHP